MKRKEEALLAAGCFWGVEESFRKLPGVSETEVGYSGGKTEQPTYEAVCSGTTGHAECLRLKFDPDKISYEKILEHFFEAHDPTQLNRQGPDTGSQYRSAIFYQSPEQKQSALDMIQKIDSSKRFSEKIVTEVSEAQVFWPAEDYHQQYILKKNSVF